jgi:surface antigen
MHRLFRSLSLTVAIACTTTLLVIPAPALADPPDWAEGHRAKHRKKVKHAKRHRGNRNDVERYQDRGGSDDQPVYWEDAERYQDDGADEQVYSEDDEGDEDLDDKHDYEDDRGSDDQGSSYPRPSFRGDGRPGAIRPSSFSGGLCIPRPTGADAGAALGQGLAKQVTGGNAASAAIGGVLGAVLGSQIDGGARVADEDCTYQVLDRAADREQIAWEDTGSATRYELTPIRSFNRNGRSCREFVTHRMQRGKLLEIHRTACRDRAGAWHIED